MKVALSLHWLTAFVLLQLNNLLLCYYSYVCEEEENWYTWRAGVTQGPPVSSSDSTKIHLRLFFLNRQNIVIFLPNRDNLGDFFLPNAQLYQSLLTFSEVLIRHLLWVCNGWLVGSRHFFPVGDFTGLNFLFLHCFWQAGQQCRTLLPLRLNVELTLCLPETDWTHQRGFSVQ